MHARMYVCMHAVCVYLTAGRVIVPWVFSYGLPLILCLGHSNLRLSLRILLFFLAVHGSKCLYVVFGNNNKKGRAD